MELKPIAPLMGWDIFIGSYERLRQTGLDLQALARLAKQHRWTLDIDLEERLLQRNETILVTDATQRIVFASANVTAMTGYEQDEVLGKRPAMFQGAGTDPDTRAAIRRAITARQPFRAVLLNYRKDASSYYCGIEAYPVFDSDRKMVHFIAFEQEQRVAV